LNNLVLGTVVGSAAGIIGTGLGGAFGFLLNNPSKRFLSTILSMSAGLMMAVVCFDLLPRSFELSGFGIGLSLAR
jgi:ZIP family zinc transporter